MPRFRIEISFTPHLTNPRIGPLGLAPLGLDRAKRTHRLVWLHAWLWNMRAEHVGTSWTRERCPWAGARLSLSKGSGAFIWKLGLHSRKEGGRYAGLSLSKPPNLRTGPFDELRAHIPWLRARAGGPRCIFAIRGDFAYSGPLLLNRYRNSV